MLSRARPRRASLAKDGSVAFPTRQLFVLALCRICEPIAFMSIFPYIYYMVLSFNISHDEHQTAIYAGMVTSAFAFAEFSTGLLWGRLSDKVGRKPILLTGLAGTGLSMLMFGFAPSLPVALVARALGGLLNGNIGVLQTTVAEVVTVEAHQPRAYSIMPFVWCLGSIIGAGLGGTLAEPVKNYPSAFQPGTLFDHYPYLLPNLVCAFVVVCSLVVGILFLEETHEDKKHRRDLGLELGQWILCKFCRRPEERISDKVGYFEETLSFLAEDEHDQPPGYRSTEASPRPSYAQVSSPEPPRAMSLREALTPQVLLIIIGYGILAFHTMSFEQLFPVLLSQDESKEPATLPFKFTGGFALSTKKIGFILSAQGVFQMISQIFIFPIISKRLGFLWTFRFVVLAYPLLHFLTPYLALLPEQLRMPGVYFILIWKVTAQTLAFPTIQIMLANAAPSKKVLGALNGAAASSASLCRALGPTLSGAVQSLGLSLGYSGLPWWVCAMIALSGAIESLWMRDSRNKSESGGCQSFALDEESAVGAPLLSSSAVGSELGLETASPVIEQLPCRQSSSSLNLDAPKEG